MEFYATSSGDVSQEDLLLFAKISAIVRELPNITFDPADKDWEPFCKNQMTCHLICRAFVPFFGVNIHDGYFTPGFEHSWLTTRSRTCIIDPYPVAGASPLIVASFTHAPWARLYQPSRNIQARFDGEEFMRRLQITVQAVAATIERLKGTPPFT